MAQASQRRKGNILSYPRLKGRALFLCPQNALFSPPIFPLPALVKNGFLSENETNKIRTGPPHLKYLEVKNMAEVQYASNGKGNLGVTLGAIGTGLGAMAGAGGLDALFGRNRNSDPEEKPVTRYEMNLIRENMAKDAQIAALEAKMYTDGKIAGVQAEISAQAVWNATQEGVIRCQAAQLAQLFGMTKLTIPNDNLNPGYGPAFVVPGVPPVVTVQTTPPTVSSGGTTAKAA